MEIEEKTCRICKRILVDDDKLGLCPKCFNKYGSIVASVGAAGVLGGVSYAVKNPKQIGKILTMSGEFAYKHRDAIGKLLVDGIKMIK